jgi:hypothetical protein
MFRTNVNEMNVQPINLGDEIRQGVQLGLDLALIVICRPIAGERLGRRELHALRCIRDRFPLGPLCRVDAPAQFGEFRFRNINMEGTDCVGAFLGNCSGPVATRRDAWSDFDLIFGFHIRVSGLTEFNGVFAGIVSRVTANP